MTEAQNPTPDFEYSWEELTRFLLAREGIKEGLWRVGLKMSFSAMTADWPELNAFIPTVAVGISNLALIRATEPGPMIFDASVLAASSAEKIKRKPVSKAVAPGKSVRASGKR